jgi:hypothetical protein
VGGRGVTGVEPPGSLPDHPTFADFRAAVQDVLDRVPTTHAQKLTSLTTFHFQEFDDVSLLAA